jgi:putative Mg2+ transporter-C (MgtC) family protein
MFTTTDFVIRLALAAVLGGAIGLEREFRAKEAGMRTHFLVAMGSALFMILSQYGFDLALRHYASTASFDPSRIASQVVTGIGFIGAGTIIFQKHVVRGLTTAAGLWVTSAIGMTIGAGLYTLGLASTVLVLICLEALNFVARRFGVKKLMVTFSTKSHDTVKQILQELQNNGVDFDSYEMHRYINPDGQQYEVTMEVKVKRKNYREQIMDFVKDFNGVSIEMME